jgi:hypothetical protein
MKNSKLNDKNLHAVAASAPTQAVNQPPPLTESEFNVLKILFDKSKEAGSNITDFVSLLLHARGLSPEWGVSINDFKTFVQNVPAQPATPATTPQEPDGFHASAD